MQIPRPNITLLLQYPKDLNIHDFIDSGVESVKDSLSCIPVEFDLRLLCEVVSQNITQFLGVIGQF